MSSNSTTVMNNDSTTITATTESVPSSDHDNTTDNHSNGESSNVPAVFDDSSERHDQSSYPTAAGVHQQYEGDPFTGDGHQLLTGGGAAGDVVSGGVENGYERDYRQDGDAEFHGGEGDSGYPHQSDSSDSESGSEDEDDLEADTIVADADADAAAVVAVSAEGNEAGTAPTTGDGDKTEKTPSELDGTQPTGQIPQIGKMAVDSKKVM
jgi:hypothetical protein